MSTVATNQDSERLAARWLDEAKFCLSAGRRGRAEMWLADVLDHFPETGAAGEARRLLENRR